MMRTGFAATALLLVLAACQDGEPSGELTADDARQLNEAEAMLDNADAVAVSEDAAANGADATVTD